MKLRTLKDLEIGKNKDGDYIGLIDPYMLKQEAIKWIKEFKYNRKGDIPSIKNKDGSNVVFSPSECGIIHYWIKHFFNLTEEDLR